MTPGSVSEIGVFSLHTARAAFFFAPGRCFWSGSLQLVDPWKKQNLQSAAVVWIKLTRPVRICLLSINQSHAQRPPDPAPDPVPQRKGCRRLRSLAATERARTTRRYKETSPPKPGPLAPIPEHDSHHRETVPPRSDVCNNNNSHRR